MDFTGRSTLFATEVTTLFLQRYSDYLRSTRKVTRVNQGKQRTTTLKPCGDVGVYNYLKDLRTIYNKYINTYDRDDLPYPFRKFKLIQPKSRPRGCTDEQLIEIYTSKSHSQRMPKPIQTSVVSPLPI